MLYAILPIDLFPDVFIGWGQIDDLIVLGAVIWYIFTGNMPGFLRQKLFRKNQSTDRHNRSSSSSRNEPHNTSAYSDMTPYEILGVSPTASKDEIRSAYRKLANQYHPDKVHHLGEEFQQLAEIKFKTIQEAYHKLVNYE